MTRTRIMISCVTIVIGLLRSGTVHAEFNLFAMIFGGGCQDCAAEKACAICVPVPTTVKHPKPVYRCKSVEYCLPKCSLHNMHGCDSCGVHYGPVHARAVLMKKIVEEEACGVKCEVHR